MAPGRRTASLGSRIRGRSASSARQTDPFDLQRRFVDTQREEFAIAIREIRAGRKQSCWSWFVFPTGPWVINGVEHGSSTNQYYALRDLPPNDLRGDDAARAFLRFEDAKGEVDLRANFLTMMTAVAEQVESGIECHRLVGMLDDPKLRSCLRLFERVSRGGFDDEVNAVCRRALTAMDEPLDEEEAALTDEDEE